MKEIIKVQIATIKDIHYNFGISTTNCSQFLWH